jgi:hypothetical protein
MNGRLIVAIDDLSRLLNTPLGDPGSGRVRYGAAMALYDRGELSEAQLEVYREAAAHDARDPAAMLADLGLPPVALPVALSPLLVLLELSTRYLRGLVHPGAAEVRAGLARWTSPMVRVADSRRTGPNEVVARHLPAALEAIDPGHRPLAEAIAAAAPLLDWVTYDAYPRVEIGEAFATGHAFASIIGENAPFAASDFDLGLFLIAPNVLYRDHHHAAPELYAPLTGPHGWRFTPGARVVLKPAHQPVWNPPFRPHLTKVGPLPFLALFVWTRDTGPPARVLQATDWRELEEMRLG